MYAQTMNRDATPRSPQARGADAESVASENPYALVRAIETSVDVRRRFHFFVWSQNHLHALVPHQLLFCGAYQRARRDVMYEVFNSVPVPSDVLDLRTEAQSPWMRHVVDAWIAQRGHALVLDLAADGAVRPEAELLLDAGFDQLLVHGVSRPQRPSEIESLFVLGSHGRRYTPREQSYFELLMPHVHSAWLRVQATELELAGGKDKAAMPGAAHRAPITERESQILSWVREGMSNQQIGAQLGISVLTVKNHVQKILQKLGAANRAQAVAKAMTMNLLDRDDDGGREGPSSR
jgi:transcriptional regulator EpsA